MAGRGREGRINARTEHGGVRLKSWNDVKKRLESDFMAPSLRGRVTYFMTRYEHVRPDGSSWVTVCSNPSGGEAGENLAAGNTAVSPETVVQTWMNSESHRANILSDKFTKMAVGFVFDPNSQYKTYWSQFFNER